MCSYHILDNNGFTNALQYYVIVHCPSCSLLVELRGQYSNTRSVPPYYCFSLYFSRPGEIQWPACHGWANRQEKYNITNQTNNANLLAKAFPEAPYSRYRISEKLFCLHPRPAHRNPEDGSSIFHLKFCIH